MSFPLITPELIARIERFHLRFNRARMDALLNLPGNPYQVEIQQFGSATAFKTRSPLLRGKNRIMGFGADDMPHLHDALQFFRVDGLRCTLSVPHSQMTPPLFSRLCAEKMVSGGSGAALCVVPDDAPPRQGDEQVVSAGLQIRESGIEDKERYLDVFQQAFGERSESQADYLLFQWAEDSLPGSRRYLAEVGGVPVGMASFIIMDGVGFCGTAGVLPAWRNRGIQKALIERRMADAPTFGCDLVLGGGSLFSTTHRNFERAGMRLVPLGFGWSDAPP